MTQPITIPSRSLAIRRTRSICGRRARLCGGRIFERTLDGQEFDWGEIVVWDPPHRLDYLWHIYGDRSDATDVSVRFEPRSGGTVVSIVHSGWDRIPAGSELRERNVGGWSGLLPHFQEAVQRIPG